MDREEIRNFLALTSIKDLGPVSIKRLVKHFGSAKAVFNSELESLLSVDGIKQETARRIKSFSDWEKIDKIIKGCEREGINIYTINDPDYPSLLREIHDSPTVLFCKGGLRDIDNFSLSIVGSRKPTDYGRRVTEKLASELASLGITIVSGLARGVDSIAHNAALSVSGRTVAILGSGVSVIYPPENKKLAERITISGALISEFFPDESPKRENFPKRNRLISGMTLGTLVTEATTNSGALITATFAIEQGREVFAVPGNITSKNSEGTNLLIKKGAKLVQSVEDILEEIAAFIHLLRESSRREQNLVDLDSSEQAIFNLLDSPMQLDEIVIKTGLSVQKVLESLLTLEIKGLIDKFEGKFIRRLK